MKLKSKMGEKRIQKQIKLKVNMKEQILKIKYKMKSGLISCMTSSESFMKQVDDDDVWMKLYSVIYCCYCLFVYFTVTERRSRRHVWPAKDPRLPGGSSSLLHPSLGVWGWGGEWPASTCRLETPGAHLAGRTSEACYRWGVQGQRQSVCQIVRFFFLAYFKYFKCWLSSFVVTQYKYKT